MPTAEPRSAPAFCKARAKITVEGFLVDVAAPADAMVLMGHALPLDLGFVGAPGCTVWCSQESTLPRATNASGGASWMFAVPQDPFLLGQPIFVQAAVADLGANALNQTFTNAGRAVSGNR